MGRRKTKPFTKGKGVYYFDIKMGYKKYITISRKSREEAIRAYNRYVKEGKEVIWQGQWDGKAFTDTEIAQTA